tara:strand:- start:5639 stop:6073 length:435 start_codon:yes stop_codon:yes gene_type:complete
MKTSKIVDTFKYYNDEFDKFSKIPYVRNIEFHHYALLTILTIIETQFSTYFILPILTLIITQFLFIKTELKVRVVQKCVGDEMTCTEEKDDELDENDRYELFISCYNSAKSTGFMYTRLVLFLKSFALMFLIYFATIGFLFELS